MAKPVLLEPMFAVEVVTPETFLGDVIGDINSRRGQVQAHVGALTATGSSMRWCRSPRCSGTLAT